MVAVHGISLSELGGLPPQCAVAIPLSEPPRRSRVHHFSAEGWEVELKQGSGHVVARTTHSLAGDALLDAAIDMAHRGLDLTSVEDGDHLATIAPANNHIVLSRVAGGIIGRHQSVGDMSIEINVTPQVHRADGTVEPPPMFHSLTWSPAFRFHRLSQGSRDLFDAFRNMFLGLEALLDHLFPKGKKEGEKAWLLRAVSTAGGKVDLTRLAAPGSANPASEIVDQLYAIRVQIFHAKTGRTLIPHERVSYLAVAEAYRTLISLWTEIAHDWLSLRRGGGVITYHGFKSMIESAFAGLRIAVSADMTPVSKSEQLLSPHALPVIIFPSPASVVEVQPGRMELRGQIEVSSLPPGQIVGRIGALLQDDKPAIIDVINGGLSLDGANVFETATTLRLINRSVPRTEFS